MFKTLTPPSPALSFLPGVGRVVKPSRVRILWKSVAALGSFITLLFCYLLAKIIDWVFRGRLRTFTTKLLILAVKLFDTGHTGSISRVDLIELSIKNMMSKRTRTLITIGGMTLGIAAIVFLVSIGYGLQQLVISRVARLEEMKQADVSPQPGGKIALDDKVLANLHDIRAIRSALPLIAVVGHVSFQSSVSDMAVYGVTTDYLKASAVKPIEGKFFESNDLTISDAAHTGTVAGASTERGVGTIGETIRDVDMNIASGAWLRVRETAATNGKILGYTKRISGAIAGQEVWGGKYSTNNGAGDAGETDDGTPLGKWVKAKALLWKDTPCDMATDGDCEGGAYKVLRDADNAQVQGEGYVAEINMTLTGSAVTEASPAVLGDSTVDSTVDWVDIASEAGVLETAQVQTIALAGSAVKQAVVNRAMLKVLGINETEAVGKAFEVSFIVVGDLVNDPAKKIESTPATYTIIGVIPEEKTPFFYVPFVDLRGLGVTQYSQTKVIVDNQNNLATARKQIEAMGFVTRSVADTVAQINSLFGTMRLILALLGMVALAVAALGMFNTLTVSLLERTREVGLMKAMGMKSSEVQELFLTESMIMGFVGGIVGILVGFIAGKLIGLLLSIFSLFRGGGLIDVSYLPLPFLLLIVFLSLFVGIATGMYPAKRATRISALNALRYE